MAPNPRIVIVGAGIAGLSIAIMLERAGMQRYVILEKAASSRPFGSAIVLSAIMLRCCEQLGLLPEIIEASKPAIGNVFLDEDLKYIGSLSSMFFGHRYGYFNIVIPRPDFLEILCRHVPAKKIHYGKKVLSLTQTNESAHVRCSDNMVYDADIVIGADGAYSGTRQSFYRDIQQLSRRNISKLEERRGGLAGAALKSMGLPSRARGKGASGFGGGSSVAGRASRRCGGGGIVGPRGEIRLPKSDEEPLRFDQHAVVGLTRPLDPEKYPFLKDKSCQVVTVVAENGFSVWLLPVTKNRICWNVNSRTFSTPFERQQAASGVGGNFMASEWGPEAVDKLLELDYVKNQKSPYGGTMQDLFDQTEKGTPAYKTWYYKRTVLIGDACHKLIPFSGIGALHAVLDCIILVNALYDMPDGDTFTAADITQAFQSYYAQRYESAAAAVKGSAQVSKIMTRSSAFSHMIRKATIAGMPDFMVRMAGDRIFANRPILSFLPFVPDYGARKSNPQPLGRRDREELELLKQQAKNKSEEEAKRRKAKGRRRLSLSSSSGEGADPSSSSSSLTSGSGGSQSSGSGGGDGGGGAMAGLGSVRNGASRILRAATASTFMLLGVEKPLPSSRQRSETTITRGKDVELSTPPTSSSLSPSAGSSSSESLFMTTHVNRRQGPAIASRPWCMNNTEVSTSSYDASSFASLPPLAVAAVADSSDCSVNEDNVSVVSDATSMFSFSSRYTLPYDAEELASQYYLGRRAVYPYTDMRDSSGGGGIRRPSWGRITHNNDGHRNKQYNNESDDSNGVINNQEPSMPTSSSPYETAHYSASSLPLASSTIDGLHDFMALPFDSDSDYGGDNDDNDEDNESALNSEGKGEEGETGNYGKQGPDGSSGGGVAMASTETDKLRRNEVGEEGREVDQDEGETLVVDPGLTMSEADAFREDEWARVVQEFQQRTGHAIARFYGVDPRNNNNNISTANVNASKSTTSSSLATGNKQSMTSAHGVISAPVILESSLLASELRVSPTAIPDA
ncbi:hypothetical protein BGZ99_008750 [Dissophora globulifera]|uniref:FAD-binding domain-containing protein n=1 Tax=Dissophora globulifera TaxID=979702 RepID=A0A9P6R7H6_9FUNG|nr:hypothetical protein BGZ99_008750 [Dissophora globulifera]